MRENSFIFLVLCVYHGQNVNTLERVMRIVVVVGLQREIDVREEKSIKCQC
jgi:hypothetical protein